jgi:hypothetical protein
MLLSNKNMWRIHEKLLNCKVLQQWEKLCLYATRALLMIRVIQKDWLNFIQVYFLIYISYVNDLHNIWKRRSQSLKYHCSSACCVAVTMNISHQEYRTGTSFLAPTISWSHTLWFFLVGVCKRRSLCTTSTNNFHWPKKRITTAANLMMQDILFREWDEFSYHLYVICVTGGGHIEHL